LASLTKIPGVGRKTAERLIVEMRDRLKQSGSALAQAMPAGETAAPADEAFGALVALGYRAPEALRLLKLVEGKAESTASAIRAAGGQAMKAARAAPHTIHRRSRRAEGCIPETPEEAAGGADSSSRRKPVPD
jgi:hypothetical protein